MTLINNSVASDLHDKQSDDLDPALSTFSCNPSDGECLHSARNNFFCRNLKLASRSMPH